MAGIDVSLQVAMTIHAACDCKWVMLRVLSSMCSCQKGILCTKSVRRNPLSSQGYSEKELHGKMSMKHLVSSAGQCSCTSVVDSERYLARHDAVALDHPLYFLD